MHVDSVLPEASAMLVNDTPRTHLGRSAPRPVWTEPPMPTRQPVDDLVGIDDVFDTPLFDETARHGAIPEDDAARTIRVVRALPERWQEVLWYTRVEGVSVTEASVHLGLTPEVTSALVVRALDGLSRAWVGDYIGAEPLPRSCASALWHVSLVGIGQRRGPGAAARMESALGRHLALCARCQEAEARLAAVGDRLSAILLPIALEHLDG